MNVQTAKRDQQYRAVLPVTRIDDGLFGPGSASWKIWSHPAAIPGVARSFVLDMTGSPQGAAAMEEHSFYRQDPLGRFRRTMHYFYSLVYGDTAEVTAANQRLRRLHRRIEGTEPMTGRHYAALDPFLQLGTMVNTWHSVYYAYEMLGGRPTHEDEEAFFAEGLVACAALGLERDPVLASAERHGVDLSLVPDDLPVTREDYRRLWAATRHLTVVTNQTRAALEAILTPRRPDNRPGTVALFAAYPLMGRVALALVPRHIRNTAGLPTSITADRVALASGRAVFSGLHHAGLDGVVLGQVSEPAHQLWVAATRPGRG